MRVAAVAPEAWPVRTQPGRWSVSECVAHLNLTSEAFIPKLQQALEKGVDAGHAPRRYRRDPAGWLLWATMPPPVRFRIKTNAGFVPESDAPVHQLVSDFKRLQQAQLDLVEQADGLPLSEMRIQSPFAERVSYNVFAALSILPRHQHRHLWQAEQVHRARPDFRG